MDQRIGFKDNGTQTWTVYDGTGADANPYADFNSSGNLTDRYLFGPGVVNGAVASVILARTSAGGTTAWYLTDKLGSVRDIVSTSGTELDHLVYDSFGNIVTETSATNGDRFKFAGMQYDSESGLYYDHARSYAPTVGRFAAMDPIGMNAGDTDLYRYVGNGPLNHDDPTGEIDDPQLTPINPANGGTQAPSITPPLPSKTLPEPIPPKLDTQIQPTGGNQPNPRRPQPGTDPQFEPVVEPPNLRTQKGGLGMAGQVTQTIRGEVVAYRRGLFKLIPIYRYTTYFIIYDADGQVLEATVTRVNYR